MFAAFELDDTFEFMLSGFAAAVASRSRQHGAAAALPVFAQNAANIFETTAPGHHRRRAASIRGNRQITVTSYRTCYPLF